MDEVTVYATTLQAVRRTADDCRRMISLLDAFGVHFSVMHMDTPESRAFLSELLARNSSPARPLTLPLCFVGPALVGSFDELSAANESDEFAKALREKGYAGPFRRGVADDTPVQRVAVAPARTEEEGKEEEEKDKEKDKDKEEEEKEKEGEEEDEEDEEPPPPPPEEDEEEEGNDGADSALGSELSDNDAEKQAKHKGRDGNGEMCKESEEEDEDDLPPPPPSDDENEMESDEEPPPPPPDEDDDEE